MKASARGAIDRTSPRAIFRLRDIALYASAFGGIVLASNAVVRLIRRHVVTFDCPPGWPISIVSLRIPGGKDLLVALGVVCCFYVLVRVVARMRYRLGGVIVAGLALTLGTNLVQGWTDAFVTPIAGLGGLDHGIQYYHDAITVTDAWEFFRHYTHRQPGLLNHSQTHPPGAVLTLYALIQLLEDPAAIAIVLAVAALVLSAIFLHGLLRRYLADAELAGYVTLLFLLIPSVQIYYAASLDALIAAALLGVVYGFTHPRSAFGIPICAIFLLLASFLTFGFVFVVPVIVGFEWLTRRSILRSGVVLSAVGIVYVLIYVAFDFNYVESLLIASILENPRGFMLVAEPASYIFTRLECCCEILVFFGPFLSVLCWRGFKAMRKSEPPAVLAWLGVVTLLAMFATGAFRTGETARACLFIYPYLILPVAAWLQQVRPSLQQRKLLLGLVFGQAVCMQLAGNYFW